MLDLRKYSVVEVSIWKYSIYTKTVLLAWIVNQVYRLPILFQVCLKLIRNFCLWVDRISDSCVRFFISLCGQSVMNFLALFFIRLQGMAGKIVGESGFAVFCDTKYNKWIFHKIKKSQVSSLKEFEESFGGFAVLLSHG